MPTVKHEIVFGKTQKKCLDCWYACIQMVRSSIAGTKTKPDGAATQKHRARFFTGKKLDFTSKEGTAIMEENNLINISDKIDLDDIDTLYKALQTYGPVIIGGDFALLNTQGHFVVVSGCDTGKNVVTIYDPGWGKGADTKTWGFIGRYLWKIPGSDAPAVGSVVAENPDWQNVEARGRR